MIPQQMFDEMLRKIRDLERQMKGIPSRFAGGGSVPSFSVGNIIGGNTLTSGQAGINYSSSQITSVPTAYNPDTDTTFITGIGRADYYVDSVKQTSKILIVNCAGVGSPWAKALLGGIMVRIIGFTSLQVGSSTNSVTAGIVAFL